MSGQASAWTDVHHMARLLGMFSHSMLEPSKEMPAGGQCSRQNLRALCQHVLPAGRTSGRTPSTLLLEPGKAAISRIQRAEVLPEAAEYVREAGEDMTNGRTLPRWFCR